MVNKAKRERLAMRFTLTSERKIFMRVIALYFALGGGHAWAQLPRPAASMSRIPT